MIPKKKPPLKKPRKKKKPKKTVSRSSILYSSSIVTCFILLLTIETQSFFIERIGGSYLNWRNKGREAYGTTWERRQHTDNAAQQLDIEAGQVSQLRRKAEFVSNFTELLAIVPDGEGVSISPEKFIELYLDLPNALQSKLIDQTELTKLQRKGTWRRTSVWKQNKNGMAYLVDDRNQILQTVQLYQSFLEIAATYGKTVDTPLSAISIFAGHIYSADRFNKLFFSLPDDKRNAFFPEPGIMLRLPKHIINVGLAPAENQDDFGIIGFEAEDLNGVTVVTYPASTATMNQLIWKFAWEGSDTLYNREINQDSIISTDQELF